MKCTACNLERAERCGRGDCPAWGRPPMDAVLEQRGSKYGNVNVQSRIFTDLMDAMGKSARVGGALPPVVRQSLYMIALKMSRIIAGGNSEPDNWTDIQGYAKLALSLPHAIDEVGQAGNQR